MREFIFLFRGGKTDNADAGQLDEHEDAWDSWMEYLEDEEVLIDGLPMRDMGVMVTKRWNARSKFRHGRRCFWILNH